MMPEWKAFAALAINWLGMPIDAMPLYSDSANWHKKADKIIAFILKNKGRYKKSDVLYLFLIFPLHTVYFLFGILFDVNLKKIKERLST